MRLRLACCEFRPSLFPTLATLAVFPILVALGMWQLGRAQVKQEVLALRSEQATEERLDLGQLREFGDAARYRPVEARGQYLAERQLLLDNRTLNGRAGYHVITPMILDNGLGALVNRGWVAVGPTRQVLPAIPAPEGKLLINGIIDRPPRPGLRLGDGVVAREGWPMVVLEVDLNAIAERLGVELLPVLVLLSPAEPAGFARRWEPDAEFGPDRHRGYAAQWFALAAALAVIYIVVNLRRVDRGSR